MKPYLFPLKPKPSESGFTIIESLLAIVVVGLLIVAIGPVIAFSAATRVQARRAEWATQAAQEYINGVRAGTIEDPEIHSLSQHQGVEYINHLRDLSTPPANGLDCKSRFKSGEDGYCDTPAPQTNQYSVYCFDGSNDGKCTTDEMQDFLIQVGGVQHEGSNGENAGYLLGLRVYRADAFEGGEPLKATDGEESQQALTHAGGLGDRKAPLFETITEITGINANYQDLCQRLSGC
ncbi:hormogonium polysaccharide secretion pseudopilin HpsB [Spirulina sp. CS-785/01]|uniref:hormogonium polysaccharide secretion pseudopilin HpsB n=1 Tax=Spirulina sp. CS-785/01 TaxID=3021716 RepID=UPI00232D9A13|nr:hormogonium polysaccharide secretion pseudopilin HpsB [Spirulina sp. CS-785/01]MDB9313684.1 hormogonium polysaccharide secretion pseudopilin HpsB [Spirulina sp. CS-785/01]